MFRVGRAGTGYLTPKGSWKGGALLVDPKGVGNLGGETGKVAAATVCASRCQLTSGVRRARAGYLTPKGGWRGGALLVDTKRVSNIVVETGKVAVAGAGRLAGP